VEIRSGDRFSDEDVQSDGIPFIQVRNINSSGGVDLHDSRRINPWKAANSRSYSEPEDILVSIAGTVGKVAMVPEQMVVCIDTSLRRLRVLDKKHVLPEYLAHYLRSDIAKLQMERWFSGSVIRVLSTPNLEQLIVYLPNIDKQSEIIETYNTLVSERIEQLRMVFPFAEQMQALTISQSKSVEHETTPPPVTSNDQSFAEIVRTQFPFPIARAFALFEKSKNDSPVAHVKKLIGLSEAVIYYAFGIFASDQLQRIKSSDQDLRALLHISLTDYSMDKKIKAVFRLIKLSNDEPNVKPFVPDIIKINFGVCSEIHNNIRNKFSHSDPPDAWCKKAVKDFEPKLMMLLEALVPIKEHRLVQITNVSVRDGRPQHHITTMMGDNSLFPKQVEDLDTLVPADTQHVILLDQDYNFLDLHPFYVFHAWENTGMQNQLCFLKHVIGMPPKQKMKMESAEGAGATDTDMDLKLSKYLSDLTA
jgi:Type I restriction modification DNA specificity domain